MSEFEKILRAIMSTAGLVGYMGATMGVPKNEAVRDIAFGPEADALLAEVMPKLIAAAKEEA